jgi:hypothetical protein
VLAHFGVTRPEELLQTVYRQDFKPAAVAALATHVQQARDEGDAVATAILDWGARELVGAAESVTKQLELTDEEFSFVLAGGMFKAVPWLRLEVTRAADDRAPKAASCSMWSPCSAPSGWRCRTAWRREASDLQTLMKVRIRRCGAGVPCRGALVARRRGQLAGARPSDGAASVAVAGRCADGPGLSRARTFKLMSRRPARAESTKLPRVQIGTSAAGHIPPGHVHFSTAPRTT